MSKFKSGDIAYVHPELGEDEGMKFDFSNSPGLTDAMLGHAGEKFTAQGDMTFGYQYWGGYYWDERWLMTQREYDEYMRPFQCISSMTSDDFQNFF